MTDSIEQMREALEKAERALWVCAEHNALHHGEAQNTVIEARAAHALVKGALAAPAAEQDAGYTIEQIADACVQAEISDGHFESLRIALAALRPQAVPIGRDDLKVLMSAAGYVHATAQEKADFINGFRHAERHHGIAQRADDGEE